MGRRSFSSKKRDIDDWRMNEFKAYYLNKKHRSETKKSRRDMVDTDEELLRICARKGWTVSSNKRDRRHFSRFNDSSGTEDSSDKSNKMRHREFIRELKMHSGKGKIQISDNVVPRRNLLNDYNTENDSESSSIPKLDIKDIKGKGIAVSDYVTTDTENGDSDVGVMNSVMANGARFANVVIKRNEWYYRSNLQTVIKDLRKLTFSETDIQYLKKTPFWFIFDAITKDENDWLLDFSRKFDDDIRCMIWRFDNERHGFVFGKSVLPITKMDMVLIFGVRDGTKKIQITREFKRTCWMERCFGGLLAGDQTRCTLQLTKGNIYRTLATKCGGMDELVGQDVARLVHCYLLASLFLPNGNTSIAWCLCKYLEDIEVIDLYDWSNLIVDHIRDQLCTTSNMKLTGCAMLLPYMICEHLNIIPASNAENFPRLLKWDLVLLHRKLRRVNLDNQVTEHFVGHLIPSKKEVLLIKTHCQENHLIFPFIDYHSEDNTDSSGKYNSDDLVDVKLTMNPAERTPVEKINTAYNNSFEVDGLEDNFVVQDTYEPKKEIRNVHCRTDGVEAVKCCSVDLDLCLGGKDVGILDPSTTVNLNDPSFDIPSFSLGMDLTPKQCKGPQKQAACNVPSAEKCVTFEAIDVLNDEPSDGVDHSKPVCNSERKSYEERIHALQMKIVDFNSITDELKKVKEELNLKKQSEEKLFLEMEDCKRESMKKSVELEVFKKQSEEMILFMDNEIENLRKCTGANIVMGSTKNDEGDEYLVKYLSLNAAHESLVSVYETERETWKCEMEQLKQVLDEVEKKLESADGNVDKLEKRLEEVMNPTSTQVYSHPDTLRLADLIEQNSAHEKDKTCMKQYIDQLIEYCKQLEGEVDNLRNGASTSNAVVLVKNEDFTCQPTPLAICDPKDFEEEAEEPEDFNIRHGKKVPEPGTIIRGVKKRTKDETRKPKQFSPECRTIVSFNGVPVQVPLKEPAERFRGECLLGPTLQLLKNSIQSSGRSVIWQGDGPYSYLTAKDAIKLLHNEHVSPNVVDSWGELVELNLRSKDKMTSTFVVTSHSWDCLTRGNIGNNVRCLVDKQLSVAIDFELIIVPVHVPAILRKGSTGLHQWILLKYNTRNGNWTLFNPLCIDENDTDPYLPRVVELVKYLENRLRGYIGNTDKSLPIARCKTMATTDLISQKQTPKQLPQTYDDGVIVCHLIDKTMKRHSISSISKNAHGFYTQSTSANFRGKMIESFCNPTLMSDLKD